MRCLKDAHGSLRFRRRTGSSRPTLREGVDRLSLNLKLRSQRIDGEVIAWRKTSDNMTVLPYWIVLEKEPAR